jgi:hypothetical protein
MRSFLSILKLLVYILTTTLNRVEQMRNPRHQSSQVRFKTVSTVYDSRLSPSPLLFQNSQLTTKRYCLRFVQDSPSYSVVFSSREMSLCKTRRLSLTVSLLAAVFNRNSQTPTTKKIGPSPYPSKQRTLTLDSNRVALRRVTGYILPLL